MHLPTRNLMSGGHSSTSQETRHPDEHIQHIQAVSVNILSPLWKENHELWFTQVFFLKLQEMTRSSHISSL